MKKRKVPLAVIVIIMLLLTVAVWFSYKNEKPLIKNTITVVDSGDNVNGYINKTQDYFLNYDIKNNNYNEFLPQFTKSVEENTDSKYVGEKGSGVYSFHFEHNDKISFDVITPDLKRITTIIFYCEDENIYQCDFEEQKVIVDK